MSINNWKQALMSSLGMNDVKLQSKLKNVSASEFDINAMMSRIEQIAKFVYFNSEEIKDKVEYTQIVAQIKSAYMANMIEIEKLIAHYADLINANEGDIEEIKSALQFAFQDALIFVDHNKN